MYEIDQRLRSVNRDTTVLDLALGLESGHRILDTKCGHMSTWQAHRPTYTPGQQLNPHISHSFAGLALHVIRNYLVARLLSLYTVYVTTPVWYRYRQYLRTVGTGRVYTYSRYTAGIPVGLRRYSSIP